MEDITNVCSLHKKGSEPILLSPIACARWNGAECFIYTKPTTSHLALGHELRHCFEGYFH